MASKSKTVGLNTNKIELEMDRCRDESNWTRILELAKSFKEKQPNNLCMADFLLGEAKLELHLEELPPIDANINLARRDLLEAKRYLNVVTSEDGDNNQAAKLDAHLLLGKLHYACGYYSEGVRQFEIAELYNLPFKSVNLRGLRIIAESYAAKGLCLRKDTTGSGSKFKRLEREEEMARCFDVATDLAILYLQRVELENAVGSLTKEGGSSSGGTHSPQPPFSSGAVKNLGVLLEEALQAAPNVLLQMDRVGLAVERYRTMLMAIETPSMHNVRLKLMLQMSDLLIQSGVGNGGTYPPACNAASITKKPVIKHKCYSLPNQFCPRNEFEEQLLVLLIAETMAVRNAVLSQSPEFRDARVASHKDASLVYDLLTVATVRWGQWELLQECFQRSMKFSFNEAHLWKQYALSLICSGAYVHAMAVLKEVIRLEPQNASNCLLSAKLCYEHLSQPERGVELCLKALERELAHPNGLLQRCHLFIGIGYHLQAEQCYLTQEKSRLREKAFSNFEQCIQLEPNDHMCYYYAGLVLAVSGDIHKALKYVRISLDLRPDSSNSLHLFALLLSADKQYSMALTVVEEALLEYPTSLGLMFVKSHLEAVLDCEDTGILKALHTAKEMLEVWREIYECQFYNSDVPECDRNSDTMRIDHPLANTATLASSDGAAALPGALHLMPIYPNYPMGYRGGTPTSTLNGGYGSNAANAMAVSRIEQALSEVVSTMSDSPTYTARGMLAGVSSVASSEGGVMGKAYLLQVEIWLLLAELYLSIDQLYDVRQCIQEASHIYPLNHQIMYMKGLVHMHKEEWNEAKVCFQNAVTINPLHVKSLQHLGLVYHYLGLQGLAETTFKEAAKIDPSNHMTWYNLGKVLEALGEYEKASTALATALMEEKKNPILPFNSVPLCFD